MSSWSNTGTSGDAGAVQIVNLSLVAVFTTATLIAGRTKLAERDPGRHGDGRASLARRSSGLPVLEAAGIGLVDLALAWPVAAARPGEDVELDRPRRPSPSRRSSPEIWAFREPRARDLASWREPKTRRR